MEPRVHIAQDEPALFQACAERLVSVAAESIARHGGFHWAVAGGATPQGLYRLLASPSFRDRVDWSLVHIWFGDERCVPPEDAQSNFRMVREALLDAVSVPPAQVHRVQGELPPEAAASDYADALRRHLPEADKVPQFDLVLLGSGPDGHIASLFPGTDALRKRRPAAAVYVPKLESWRISITLPLINTACHVILLLSGAKKADLVRHVFRHSADTNPLPVQMIRPSGELEWFLDDEAARHIT